MLCILASILSQWIKMLEPSNTSLGISSLKQLWRCHLQKAWDFITYLTKIIGCQVDRNVRICWYFMCPHWELGKWVLNHVHSKQGFMFVNRVNHVYMAETSRISIAGLNWGTYRIHGEIIRRDCDSNCLKALLIRYLSDALMLNNTAAIFDFIQGEYKGSKRETYTNIIRWPNPTARYPTSATDQQRQFAG